MSNEFKNTKKQVIRPTISVQDGLPFSQIRTLIQAEPTVFVRKFQDIVNEKKLSFSNIPSIRDLYAYTADIQVPMQMQDAAGITRTITTSAFPVITGTLGIAAINEAYQDVPTIGENLVTDLEDSKKVTTIVQVNTLDKDQDEVKESEEFPEIGASEESVEIRHKKNGRKVTISAEMISENDIVNIQEKFNALGQIAAEWIEEQTLYRVTDHYGCGASPTEPYVYRPNGTGTALYSATANTPGTRAPSGNRIESNALVDYTDISAVRTRFATFKNSRGKRMYVPWSEVVFLLPDAIEETMLSIVNSILVPGIENQTNNFGERGKYSISTDRIFSTPKLDDLSSSAWYAGAFKRQFVRKWKMRFEYVSLGMDTQAYLNSQIAAQYRLAWDMEIGARDYVFVVQCLDGTTAPVDA